MKKTFKKITSVLLVALFVFAIAPTTALSEISVTLDGTRINFDVPPQIVDGRTLVPLRAIFDALGAEIDWNPDTQTVTATRGATVVVMQVGNPVITVAGRNVTLDVAPLIVDGRTLVPARAVAESFGVDVDWDQATQTVILTTVTTQAPPASTANQPIDFRSIDSYWFYLDGIRFMPGSTVNEMITQTRLVVRNEDNLTTILGSFGTGIHTLSVRDGNIYRTGVGITARNLGRDAIYFRDAAITTFTISESTARYFDVVLIGGVEIGVTTKDEVLAIFGEPTRAESATNSSSLTYSPFDGAGTRQAGDPTIGTGYQFQFWDGVLNGVRITWNFPRD